MVHRQEQPIKFGYQIEWLNMNICLFEPLYAAYRGSETQPEVGQIQSYVFPTKIL